MNEADANACPSCGGAGGGPFGPMGSAWDDDTYVCPRCKGVGAVVVGEVVGVKPRPGIAKATAEKQVPAADPKRKVSA